MAVAAPEGKLLGLARDRSDVEVERMYRRHAADVYRYSLVVVRSPPDAEDVAQSTFVRAYRALERGERVRTPRHWLIKIAHNECLRHLRITSRRAGDVELDAAVTAAPDPYASRRPTRSAPAVTVPLPLP